ncbi:MAG: M20/M25/M40 family metallo-hydrolase [Pirellulaceae bacterium]
MNRFAFLAVLVSSFFGIAVHGSAQDSFDEYQDVAKKIIEAGSKQNDAYKKLIELCDDIGHRISGSESLNQAVEWAKVTMKKDGQENVRSETVMVGKWVRGNESCKLLHPKAKSMAMLGLGGSVATPPEGITAEVVVVSNKEEFDKLDAAKVKGKIVLFNGAMPPYSETEGSGYGTAVQYRASGAKWASEKGALAALVRSATAYSLNSPHTGALRYGTAEVRIPAAAITIEDAEMLARFQARGITPKVKLMMEAKDVGEVPSANVLAEIVGREKPEEIVVIGGHLDSWDVGQGAQDDGAGCVAAMEALNILRKLNLRPRRTIRVVLWTDEERGGAGANHYAATHQNEIHVAGIESDSGGFTPKGLSLEMQDREAESRALERLKKMMPLLAPLGRMNAETGGSGADVGKLKPLGTACMGLEVDGRLYFNTHHTHADTVDKVDPKQLGDCAIMLAVSSYLLADMPEKIGK